ncbi:MAG: hypothetical protein ACERJ2_14150 [Filomicrobium sp.]
MRTNERRADARKESSGKALRRRRYYSGLTAERKAALWLMLKGCRIPGSWVRPLANLGSIQTMTRLRIAEAVSYRGETQKKRPSHLGK